MKKWVTLIVLGLITFSVKSQIFNSDSVGLGAGAAQSCFYRLSDQNKTYVSFNDWQIAVSVRPSQFPSNPLPGTTIRVNEAFLNSIYIIPNQLSASMNQPLDTTGYSTWSLLHDSETNLDLGALNTTRNLANPFDFGWGTYSQVTHNVSGDSIFLVKTSSGFKKLWVEALVWDTLWKIHFCDIDGSNFHLFSFSKNEYSNKNFVYLNLLTNSIADKEPVKSEWDLLFLKYNAPVTQNGTTVNYNVTGVWSNSGVTVNQVDGQEVSMAAPTQNYSTNLSEIGYDWKNYINSTYVITDSSSYFINAKDGKVYHLYFTGFSGNSTSICSFNFREFDSSVSVEAIDRYNSLKVYPNPTIGGINISSEKDEFFDLYNITGEKVTTLKSGYNTLDDINSGIYFLVGGNGRSYKLSVVK